MSGKFEFNNPFKRPSAITAAMGQQAAEVAVLSSPAVQVSDAELIHRANLVLPTKQAMRELAVKLTADLDAAIEEALTAALGEPITDPDAQLAGHLFEVVPDGAFSDAGAFVALDERGEAYYLDGRKLLWAGPTRLVKEGEPGEEIMRGERRLVRFV